MALALNLTLIVQMVHFIGAYMLITRYLLKPGYEAVKADEESLHQLRTSIVHEQEKIAQGSLHKYEQWRLCQQKFMVNRPSLEKEPEAYSSVGLSESLVVFSDEEIHKAVQETTAQVKERVLDV